MNDPFRNIIRVTWGLIGICLLAFLMMLIFYLLDVDWTTHWYLLLLSVPLFIISAISLAVMYSTRQTYLSGSQHLQTGDYLVRWEFDEALWARYNKAEWKRFRGKAIIDSFGVGAFFLIVGFFVKGISHDDLIAMIPLDIAAAVLFCAFLFLYGYRTFQNNLNRKREVVIGKTGILLSGIYMAWDIVGTRLAGTRIVSGDPPMIEFEFKTWSGYGYRRTKTRIPIPPGAEKEAEEVVRKLL